MLKNSRLLTAIQILILPLYAYAQTPSFKIVFGDLHQHSNLSRDARSGALTPAAAFNYAATIADLGFMALTDHANLDGGLSPAEWQQLLDAADNATGPEFVGLGSQELGLVFGSGGYGHVAIHNSPDLADNDDFPNVRFNIDDMFDFVIERESLAHFCHPGIRGDQSSRFNNFAYVPEADPFFFGVEVLSGFRSTLYEFFYLRALENGWHVGVVTGQDNHSGQYGNRRDGEGNINLTGVLMDTLSRPNLLQAFMNHRTYAVQTSPAADRMLLNEFTADGHWMGDTFTNEDNRVNFTVSVAAQGKFLAAHLYKNGILLERVEPDASEFTWSPVDDESFGSVYYFVKVLQEDRDVLWTSPIWVNSPGEYIPPENRITSISTLRDNFANGLPRDLALTNITIRGVATAGRQFGFDGPGFLQDSTGAIAIFGSGFVENVVPTVPFEFEVTGRVNFFNGQTEITPFLTKRVGVGAFPQPTLVQTGAIAIQGEEYEGQLVQVLNAEIIGNFPPSGANANLIIDDGSGPCTLRIDKDTDIDGTAKPTGKVIITGIATQFDTTPPFDSGYQITPRSLDDFDLVTSVEAAHTESVPKRFSLSQNHPNPFNPSTRIDYTVARPSQVSLEIYNINGQKIRTLVDKESPVGGFHVIWDGTDERGERVASGVYLYRLETPEQAFVRKLLLVK